jgi:putative Mg2+ transporter-C (MgtC) family protein
MSRMRDLLLAGMTIEPMEATIRILLAGCLGFFVGLDREMKHRTLGLRTNMLVAIGSALFGILALEIFEIARSHADVAQIDPSRIVEGIIGGIGFLGAGAIIQGRGDIKGGTTAAAIWTLGGVGLACGFGLYGLALIATAIILVVLALIGFFTGSGKEEEGPGARSIGDATRQRGTATKFSSPEEPSA